MLKLKPGTLIPTPEEDATATAAAQADPDAQPMTDAEWAAVKPGVRRGRRGQARRGRCRRRVRRRRGHIEFVVELRLARGRGREEMAAGGVKPRTSPPAAVMEIVRPTQPHGAARRSAGSSYFLKADFKINLPDPQKHVNSLNSHAYEDIPSLGHPDILRAIFN